LSDIKRRSIEAVESEIQRERAEALGRAGERLEEALSVLRALRQQLEGVAGDSRVRADGNKVRYRTWHARALQLRHYLIIQREAIGLRRHEDVDRHYPMPPDLPSSGRSERGEPR
jgi:hypothetical protein